MSAKIITTEDLQEFKADLLEAMTKLLSNRNQLTERKYLKSSEVIKMFQISSGTLLNLRNNGTLPYTKIGGLIYYDLEEINKVMTENKVN